MILIRVANGYKITVEQPIAGYKFYRLSPFLEFTDGPRRLRCHNNDLQL